MPVNDFIQVHKSYIVRIDAIKSRNKNFLIMKNNDSVEISKTYLEDVNKRLNKLN